VDIDKLRREYVTGNISYRALAKKYDIPFSTLKGHAIKGGWVEQREQYRTRVDTKSMKKAEEKASDYKSTLYNLAFKIANQLVDMTEKYDLADLIALGIKPKDITGAIKDLEDALHIKSETDLKEQEARIAKLRKEASENKQDNEIKVVIASGLEDYSK
jgi:hypothetical protein